MRADSKEITSAESRWATGNRIEDYVEERWRLASDPDLLARFRSASANDIRMGQAFNALRTLANLQQWEIVLMIEAIQKQQSAFRNAADAGLVPWPEPSELVNVVI